LPDLKKEKNRLYVNSDKVLAVIRYRKASGM